MITPAKWLIKNRIIYAHGSGVVTETDLREHTTQVSILLEEGIAPIHIILDSSPDFQIKHPDLRSGIDNLRFLRHSSLGWSIQVLTGNRALAFVSTLIARFARVNYKTVRTGDEALAFLGMMDSSIDWSSLDESAMQS